MGKDRAGKPSRPYRGGHKGKGGSHEKRSCLAVLILGFLGTSIGGYGLVELVTYLI